MIYTLLAQAAKPPAQAPSSEPLLVLPTSQQFGYFLFTLGVSIALGFLVYVFLFYILRSLFRRTERDTALLFLNISQLPIIAIFLLGSLKLSVYSLGTKGIIGWIDRGLTAFLIAVFTYWAAAVFTQAAVYFLTEYARKSEAVWDDVLIPLLQNFIPVVTYLIGISLFFNALGVDLSGIGLALGSITVVLGLAVKDILSDFFSGLVLLVDTPFKFGDVISMPNGSLAIIKKIGIRVTKLYLINEHCEVYTPNTALGSTSITNLSRPTTHCAYTIAVSVRADADPVIATRILKEVVLGHPDTLGNLDLKLKHLDDFTSLREAEGDQLSKKEIGRERLSIEKEVNNQLGKIERAIEALVADIRRLEKGGLMVDELRIIQKSYQDILNLIGLVVITERKGRRSRSRLEEERDWAGNRTLIELVRLWYQAWLKDPDLVLEDQHVLPDEWEQKIDILKIKMNKLFQKISTPGADETRLDDFAIKLVEWLHESFKDSNSVWKDPQIQLTDIQGSTVEFSVRFYVDNIQLEHWWRGNRVQNEVRREIVRRLRQAYIYS
jgi:MscS family membrane protein